MSCSPIALKDYLLNELADSDRRTLEVHIKTCPACCEELDRLRLTEAALFSLREEEIPQRIAFVDGLCRSHYRLQRGGFVFVYPQQNFGAIHPPGVA